MEFDASDDEFVTCFAADDNENHFGSFHIVQRPEVSGA